MARWMILSIQPIYTTEEAITQANKLYESVLNKSGFEGFSIPTENPTLGSGADLNPDGDVTEEDPIAEDIETLIQEGQKGRTIS